MSAPTAAFQVTPHRSLSSNARLLRWRENVGDPLARDFAPVSDERCSRARDAIVVLSWNVWVGRGRIQEVVGRLREGEYTKLGAPADAELLLLVQEAFRADESVPPLTNRGAPRDPPGHFRPEEDIVEVARALRLNLRYAPSMRNGSHRSDRGNAILSTLALQDVAAFELPFVIQRRVALGVGLCLPPAVSDSGTPPEERVRRLRVYSAHLDPWGALGWDWVGVAGRATQARSLIEGIESQVDSAPPVVLGADLNITRGRREAAYQLLVESGFTSGLPHREPTWGHTYHMVPRLAIDYLLFRPREGGAASAAVHRLNENARDAGPYVFGSDHHPLLARLDLDQVPESNP